MVHQLQRKSATNASWLLTVALYYPCSNASIYNSKSVINFVYVVSQRALHVHVQGVYKYMCMLNPCSEPAPVMISPKLLGNVLVKYKKFTLFYVHYLHLYLC